ncbi:MAG: ECF-type sigma factor [Gemmataceae bacterium]|nr:ECF-type sigma factor [Gemmataceae bacterium]
MTPMVARARTLEAPPDARFHELMQHVRSGSQEAAAELVRQYQPVILKFVRIRLFRLRLHYVVENTDISQAVLADFFNGVTRGQFHIGSPVELVKLLVRMARNQVTDKARRHKARRRDSGRLETGLADGFLDQVQDRAPSPSNIVAGHELIRKILSRLTSEERFLADERARAKDWATIAAECNSTPEALRKKLFRAIQRVAGELGLNPIRFPGPI